VLAGHPNMLRFFDGPPERGGWGATVVVLKR
jgi:DNA-nicking Smr family endonuclease